MGGQIGYRQAGDYLLPEIRLTEVPAEEMAPLGRYGRMRRAFLREHRPILYNRLLLSETLFSHLRQVDEVAEVRRSLGVPEGTIIKELVCEV